MEGHATYTRTVLTETRAVLAVLGFRSVRDFAIHVPMSPVTCITLLCETGKHVTFLTAMRAFQALHGRFNDVKANLTKSQRSFVASWAKRWAKEAMGKIHRERHMPRPQKNKHEVRRTKRRRSAIREMQARAFASLSWR